MVNEVTKPAKDETNDSAEEDEPKQQRSRPMAMVILDGYSLDVGETK